MQQPDRERVHRAQELARPCTTYFFLRTRSASTPPWSESSDHRRGASASETTPSVRVRAGELVDEVAPDEHLHVHRGHLAHHRQEEPAEAAVPRASRRSASATRLPAPWGAPGGATSDGADAVAPSSGGGAGSSARGWSPAGGGTGSVVVTLTPRSTQTRSVAGGERDNDGRSGVRFPPSPAPG